MGILYVVATPIGNLEDMSMRAIRVLREASLVAAEDTRVTRKLLAHFDIKTPLLSYYEHNKLSRLPQVLDVLATGDVALVSDAGTPGINDPGYELVLAAVEHGIRVVPVPGASALTAALAVCGIPATQFLYLGFLPRTKTERLSLLGSVAAQQRALVCFETPHRLIDALRDAQEALGDRRVAVARELTKMYEEVFRGAISAAIAHFTEPRGELVLVFEGASATAEPRDEAWARRELTRLRDQGVAPREAVSAVAQASGMGRREVYRVWVEMEHRQ